MKEVSGKERAEVDQRGLERTLSRGKYVRQTRLSRGNGGNIKKMKLNRLISGHEDPENDRLEMRNGVDQ